MRGASSEMVVNSLKYDLSSTQPETRFSIWPGIRFHRSHPYQACCHAANASTRPEPVAPSSPALAFTLTPSLDAEFA